jgi:uncharacterized protein with HEPN domain
MKPALAQREYLLHVRYDNAAVEEYTPDGRDAFVAGRMIQDAVIRNP